MTPNQLSSILARIREISVGILGDFCLDAYWELDAGAPELSIETGKPTRAVRTQRYSPGGAGNVAANVASLGVKRVQAFGVIGSDLFGRAMTRILEEHDIEPSGMVIQPDQWDTPVYAKPYLGSEEQNRIDFGRFNNIAQPTIDSMLGQLESSLPHLNALIINQQLPRTLYTREFVSSLNQLAERFSTIIFLADARDHSLDFKSMMCKINAIEAGRIFGRTVHRNEEVSDEEVERFGNSLHDRFGKAVCITRGSAGLFLMDGRESYHIQAVKAGDLVDPVGAGDTVVAALASALAAGASLKEAGTIASLAASVTVRKIRQTGTAAPEEILALVTHDPLPA